MVECNFKDSSYMFGGQYYDGCILKNCGPMKNACDGDGCIFQRKKTTIEDLNIYWVYSGQTKGFHIQMAGEQIYFARDERDRDMFIAELKGRLLLNQSSKMGGNEDVQT